MNWWCGTIRLGVMSMRKITRKGPPPATGIKGSFWQPEGMHVLFTDANYGATGQVHIDYRTGISHMLSGNSDVLATGNYKTYKNWYGPIPGYNP